MATRMQQRRGTAGEWTSADPILGAGEIGYETNTNKFKIGDGVTAWSSLVYFTSIEQIVGSAPALLDTLDELAQAIGDDPNFITTINDKVDSKAGVQVSDSVPTTGPDGSESLQEGDFWYDGANGHLYTYFNIDESNSVWVETGGSDDYADTSLGTNNHDFPTSPSNGDTHKGYVYDSSRTAWKIDRSFEVGDASNVTITAAAADEILMFDGTSTWENVAGVRLDANGEIPLAYTAPLQALIEGSTATLTVKTTAEWATDTSTPEVGSLNVETASGILLKLGNGTDTFANLPYVPTNSSVTTAIATALADYATKASPTFTGTVSLPADTSIGNVDATEIGHLDGVTSAIQTQIDAKAPTADPTFTGTVAGVTKGMVGLGNVDNTADADKPVSTAAQTALDAKAALAGATFTGDVEAPNLVVSGNLTVQGETTTISASNLSVRDNMLYLNQAGLFDLSNAVGDGTDVVYTTTANHDIKVGDYITVTGANPSSFDISGEGSEVTAITDTTITVASTVTDTYVDSGELRGKSHANPDLGWAAGRYDTTNGSGYAHAGMFRDASDGVFKFFDGYVPEPDEDVFVDTSHASFALAPIAPSKVVFPDGTEQTKAGVPSLTSFTEISSTDSQATVSGATGDGAAVTITTSADHGFSQGDSVVIAGMDPAGYDGTYTIASVPTTTTFTVAHTETGTFVTGGTATVTTPGDYTLNTLDHQDNIVEMNSSVAATFTIPTNANLAWPVGASMDVFATGTGEITIAGDAGVTVNATPGLILRTQWSSATILKRGTDSWVVYGDLKA